jgi:hypothetical protein
MSIAALLLAWAFGWPWVRASRAAREYIWLEVVLALPVGLGATAACFFVFLWAGLAPRPAAMGGDAVVALCGLVAWRLSASGALEPLPKPPVFRWMWLAAGALAVGLLLFTAGFYSASKANPQGSREAWAGWNLRAKFLTDAATWRLAVSRDLAPTHPEYPLLWPAVVARAWVYGDDRGAPAAPVSAAFLTGAATILLLTLSLSMLHSATLGCLAGLILLTAASFWGQAPAQYPEVPLSLWMLASLAVAILAERKRWLPGALALSGFLAALAAFTKTEGLVFLVVMAGALGFVSRARILPWLAGALPMTALVIGFQSALSPRFALFDARALTDWSRLSALLTGTLQALWDLGSFPSHPILLLVLLAALLRPLRPLPAWWPAVVVLLVVKGDALLLWGLPGDFAAQLQVSLDRLLAQALPALLLSACLLLRAPASQTEPAEPLDRSATQSHRRKQR